MEESRYYEGYGAEVISLREQAHEAASQSTQEWLADSAEVIKTAQALDVSEAFSYFWDETPNEETFDMADIPEVDLPGPLEGTGRGGQALFVESEAPVQGLGWSMLLDGPGTAGSETLSHLNSVAYAKGVATAAVGTDPGAVAMEPGLVERAGALLYFDRTPGARGSRRFYERLAPPEQVREWSAVMQVFPYAQLDRDLYGDRLQRPQVIHYLPIDGRRRVRPVGPEQAIPMVIPGLDPHTKGGETIGNMLVRGHRPLLLAVLFSLACAGAMKGHRHTAPQLRLAGRDCCGPLKRLVMEDRMGNLKASLDGRGEAADLGLSHALTVCRDEFGPDPRRQSSQTTKGGEQS